MLRFLPELDKTSNPVLLLPCLLFVTSYSLPFCWHTHRFLQWLYIEIFTGNICMLGFLFFFKKFLNVYGRKVQIYHDI